MYLKTVIITVICLLFFVFSASAEMISFNDPWNESGVNLLSTDAAGVDLTYSMNEFGMEAIEVDGISMQNVILPGVILPNNAGAPNLPGYGRFIAVPEGARASVRILDYRREVYRDIEIAPAPPIPLDTDDSPPVFIKDPAIYNVNALYPESPVLISEPTEIRGVDIVTIGVSPFQYNPVAKELTVYRDIVVRVDFVGGNGQFGEARLRSRYFDPILQGNIINFDQLPEVDYDRIQALQTDEDNVEYLIIVPDDPVFLMWADTLKQWRKQQGIITGITTLTEIGGNNTTLIENYVNNAYNNWAIPPVAVLLLSDYQSSGDVYGITSPSWNNYCVSDNIYADVDGNDLPDMVFARITAQTYQHLATMIGKMMDYERTPPTDPGFYQHPITAGGWQTERWFILCTEICWGFMHNELGKVPVREYAIYSGSPGTQWSSNTNTYMLLNYFGPQGLGYIPSTPSHLNDWGASATRINNDINDGAFLLLHRDHGSNTGWGEPDYQMSDLNGLNNEMLPYVFSINCLTGEFNWSNTCFSEAFHRMEHGALGVMAASEISYSFVNDTYIFGIWDSMWPAFDPEYGPPTSPNNLRPAFANAHGKYYLAASNWPYNPNNKVHTYHLFHHHGDAFITLYSEVPEEMTVVHNNALLGGMDEFTVTANAGAVIALTVNNEIIGTAAATGAPVTISIPPQNPGETMLVTVTLQNYYRYMQEVQIVPPEGPYVIISSCEIEDGIGWNPNGNLDYGESSDLTLAMENIGVEVASAVTVNIVCDDPLLSIIDGTHYYGDIQPGSIASFIAGFEVDCSEEVEDGYIFTIDVEAVSGITTWESSFIITACAPEIQFDQITVNDPLGNNNNWLDPGETADLEVFVLNEGGCLVNNLSGLISSIDPYLTINSATANFGTVEPGEAMQAVFNVTASATTPMEHICPVNLDVDGDLSYSAELEFGVMVGNILNDPTGPDNHGYSAYDPFDLPEMPVYDWIEISADSGGPGQLVNFTLDDQCLHYALPFDFSFYGLEYDTITVGCNGWVGFGIQTNDDYSNSGIPSVDGPHPAVLAYWEDLSPQRPNSGKVWRWYDSVNHLMVIEFNHIEQYAPQGSFETFQVVLHDPDHYQTSTGDGKIKVQYKDMSAAAQTEGTIGIEDETESDGIQYFFDGDYDIHAHPIENQTCIMYTVSSIAPEVTVALTPVNPPIIIPAGGAAFDYIVDIDNIGTSTIVFDVWIDVVLPGGTVFGPIILRTDVSLPAGVSIFRTMSQNVPGGAPSGSYTYRCSVGTYPATIIAADEFDFTKTGVNFASGGTWDLTGWDEELTFDGTLPDNYYLAQNQPNPFNPVTNIAFGLPEASKVEISVFNLLGRQVAELQNGWMDAGNHQVSFDASLLSSGVYFYSMKTGSFQSVKKMLLVK